jgi:hypothetical protein
VISTELVTFLESGCGLIVGTASSAGVPRANRGWGLEVLDAGRVRVLLRSDDPVLVDDLAENPSLAVTGADVHTLRSVQLKGRIAVMEPASEADHERSARYRREFFAAIQEIDGFSRAQLERLIPDGLISCEMVIAEVYDQTPGPGAGAAIVRTGQL